MESVEKKKTENVINLLFLKKKHMMLLHTSDFSFRSAQIPANFTVTSTDFRTLLAELL
jgi:hypothetical protein